MRPSALPPLTGLASLSMLNMIVDHARLARLASVGWAASRVAHAGPWVISAESAVPHCGRTAQSARGLPLYLDPSLSESCNSPRRRWFSLLVTAGQRQWWARARVRPRPDDRLARSSSRRQLRAASTTSSTGRAGPTPAAAVDALEPRPSLASRVQHLLNDLGCPPLPPPPRRRSRRRPPSAA
jgi:hypothetical protein